MRPHARLGELCTLNYGKALRGYEKNPQETLPVKVFGTNGPIGWVTTSLYENPTIVIGRKGAYRGVHYTSTPSWTIDTAYYLTLRGNSVDLKWLYYRLLLVDINRMDTGAAIPSTKREDFYSISIEVPSLQVQRHIASILSAYDDLIENNRRRIQLLEQSARLLYQEWFIHLRFPGHEHVKVVDGVPEGWERSPLGERIVLNYGKALKADNRVEGPYPVYGSSGIVGTHEKPLTTGPGIIVGRKGNVGSVFWTSQDYYPIDTVYFIDAETSNLYLFYALQNMQFLSTDVAVPGLNRDLAYSRPLLWPSERLLNDFLETAAPIHEQIAKLEEINIKLAQARDLLLPRLMNGEIPV